MPMTTPTLSELRGFVITQLERVVQEAERFKRLGLPLDAMSYEVKAKYYRALRVLQAAGSFGDELHKFEAGGAYYFCSNGIKEQALLRAIWEAQTNGKNK